MTGRLSLLLATLAAATAAAFFAPSAAAQFREEAFSQQYNSDDPSQQDSVEVLFSLKEYFDSTDMHLGPQLALLTVLGITGLA